MGEGLVIAEKGSEQIGYTDKGGVNKAAVAMANKNARIAMAMILSGSDYRKAA